MRAIEFYAGVGGFATAAARVWGDRSLDIVPIDIDQTARRVYELNHAHKVWTREIESLSARELQSIEADLWWLSPPCQPYSRRGHQRDLDDPRAASLVHLISMIEEVKPSWIALENVVGFARSRACGMLRDALSRAGYSVLHREMCPTELGWPNRRPRFYLIASIQPVETWQPPATYHWSVAELIEGAQVDPIQCMVDAESLSRFESGMNRVDPAIPHNVTACFGSSYGKSLLHAGSYCAQQGTYRRFSPSEVARLLGFPIAFKLPEDLRYRRLWKLLGNSLSIPAVEYVLSQITAFVYSAK